MQRFIKIHTRTGDTGTTSLADGTRLSKDDLRIHALGDVDELNCILGTIIALDLPISLSELIKSDITTIQNDLFNLGSELALPGHTVLNEALVTRLENSLESLNTNLPPLRAFILPQGSAAAANCHLARAVCRRAERSVVSLARNEAVHPLAIRYLNRLSDLLFVMARVLNHGAGKADEPWHLGTVIIITDEVPTPFP